MSTPGYYSHENNLIIIYITATCVGSMNLTTSDNLSSYQAKWRSQGDRVDFLLTGEGQGWVGIGFSHNRMMVISFPLLVKNIID